MSLLSPFLGISTCCGDSCFGSCASLGKTAVLAVLRRLVGRDPLRFAIDFTKADHILADYEFKFIYGAIVQSGGMRGP